jgi:cytochrome c551
VTAVIDRTARRRPLLLAVAALALASSLAGCGGDDGGSGAAGSGEDLYRQNCATCHATDGGGGLGPSLKGIADRMPREEHKRIVLEGKGQMPAWKENLSPEEVDAVVDYERTLE